MLCAVCLSFPVKKCVVGRNSEFVGNNVLMGRAAQAIVYTHLSPRLLGLWPVDAAPLPIPHLGSH